MKKILMIFSLLFLAFACNQYEFEMPQDGKDGLNGANAAWSYEAFGPNDDYPAGGVKVVTGLDNYPYDGILDVEVGPGFVLVNGLDAQGTVGSGFPEFSVVDCELFAGTVNLGNVCGADGADGTKWTISEDGFWVEDGVKTDTPVRGPTGPQGPKGEAGLPGINGTNGTNGVDGKDGLTLIPWPLVTEIAPDEEHTNGGLMYTWYMLGEDLQITESSQIIGVYPVWHGNDGKDGDSFYWNEETNTIWVNNYNTNITVIPTIEISENNTWIINGKDTGKPTKGADGIDGENGESSIVTYDGCSLLINGEVVAENICGADGAQGPQGPAGIDGKSPYVGEDGFWYYWNGITWIKGVKAKGDKGDKGDDGTVVTYGVEYFQPGEECENGGVRILVYYDDVYDHSFYICNGPTGPIGPQGPQGPSGNNGENGADGYSALIKVVELENGCVNIYAGIDNVVINGEFDRGEVTSMATVCNGADADPVEVSIEEDGDCVTVTIGDEDPFTICDGDKGDPGDDGITPVIEVSQKDEDGCVTVTITTGDQVETYEICDGIDGDKGDPGDDGTITRVTLTQDEECVIIRTYEDDQLIDEVTVCGCDIDDCDDGCDDDEDKKVTLCHKEFKWNKGWIYNTLKLPISAVPAHILHGDVLGECDRDPS